MSTTEEAKASPPAGAKSPLIPIMLVFNSVVLLGVGGLLYLKSPTSSPAAAPAAHGKPGSEPAPKEDEHAAARAPAAGENERGRPLGPMVALPDFVIHLRNTEVDRYVRLTMEVELTLEADKERFTSYMPQIRDSFIGYLSDRTLEELQGSEGIARAKQGLLELLETIIPRIRIRNIYITDFVVQ